MGIHDLLIRELQSRAWESLETCTRHLPCSAQENQQPRSVSHNTLQPALFCFVALLALRKGYCNQVGYSTEKSRSGKDAQASEHQEGKEQHAHGSRYF